MAEAVYILCALTSLACAVLLTRAWLASRQQLLLGSALCFLGLGANNVFIVIDKLVLPDVPFYFWPKVPALIGLAIYVVVLVWERE